MNKIKCICVSEIRMRQFLDTVLQPAARSEMTGNSIQVPSPLTMVQPPLQRLCTVYVPLVQMNRAVGGFH